ncbi:MAG: dihydrolipoamide acetyltransferase family protein [Myxococcota bacterium]|nr:dihydrolipoamide acetyltransferase family protein [Myxococcota bacterium]
MKIGVELPALGESVLEGTVSRWLVAVGDWVEVDQPLVEVTTDKVDAEIPAPSAGVVVEILAAEGEVVPVGGALAGIDPEATASSAKGQPPAEAIPASEAPEPRLAAPDLGSKSGSASRATPVARRLADEHDLPIETIDGSGSDGRVTKRDVLRHAEASAPAPPAPPAPPPARSGRAASPGAGSHAAGVYTPVPGDRVIPMSPMRRIIAEHMVYSKHTSPHVGTVAEVDMSAIVALRAGHKVAFEEANGFALTYLPFIAHAVVRALKEFPALNASVLEGAIVEKKHVNLGLAVETEKGLIVPVVRDADRFSLAGLAAEINDLASRARNKKLSADDLQGGSFTVSNPGRQGNLYGFAIINQPQVGIIRMGEMIKRPVVRTVLSEDAIVIRPMMHVALSYDHRAVDGSPANGFLYRIRELLERADYDL